MDPWLPPIQLVTMDQVVHHNHSVADLGLCLVDQVFVLVRAMMMEGESNSSHQ